MFQNDDVEELNLRLNALKSLAGAKKRQKPKSMFIILLNYFI